MNNFYNREDLDVKSVVQLIRLWELDAGESFTDYCSFHPETNSKFLEFLEQNYPALYEYRQQNKELDCYGNLEDTIQYVFQHCVAYCTQWVPNGRYKLYNQQYELAYYPLAEFILEDDVAWQTFVEFFTDPSNTSEDIPWIDCYNIRKDFEEWKVLNFMK